MSLLIKIDNDLKDAMKAGEKLKLTVLRGLKSDFKYKQIEKGDDLDEDEITGVISSAAKRRKDSIEQFTAGNRMDLADKETAELKILQEYLPEQISDEKLRELITASIKETGAESPQQFGLVMKDLMPKLKGQTDGKIVKKLVGEILSNS